jgi:hypothetical protein
MTKVLWFHPPDFFPPLDFFFGLLNSDVWIVVDHTSYTARSRQSRCRVKSSSGITQLPVTVVRPCTKPLCRMVINEMYPWRRLFLRNIRQYYSEAPFFDEYYDAIRGFIEGSYVLLETLTLESCLWVADLLGKKVDFIRTSEMRNCDGKPYTKFPMAKIIPLMLDRIGGHVFDKTFEHPYYPQVTEPFEKDLSIIDSLFCIGADNVKELLNSSFKRTSR